MQRVVSWKCCAGHYISYVHVSGQWFCFDDASVSGASQANIEATFGASNEWVVTHDTHAYLLFYERIDGPWGAKSSDASASGSASAAGSGRVGGAGGAGSGGSRSEAVAEGAAPPDVHVRMRARRHRAPHVAIPAPPAARA